VPKRTSLIALVGVAIMIVAVPTSAAASSPAALLGGQTLTSGQTLLSSDGHYELAMQGDGNLVLYWMNGASIGHAMWSSETDGDTGDHALLQDDGNLVLLNPQGETLWSSNTSDAGCANLIVQDDGNLVLYNSTHAVWSSKTVQTELTAGDKLTIGERIFSLNEQYEVAMQSDGNLVLYGPPGAMWSSGTDREPGNYAVMQGDGNLVVYNPSGRAMWASDTDGDSGAYAVQQEDGNFVIYSGGKPRWSSATDGRKPSSGASQFPRPAFTACPPPPPPPAPPPPPPTTTPSSPVVDVPVTTRLRRLRVKMSFSWTWDRGVTHLHRIQVPRLPHGATIAIECAGRGCRRRVVRADRHVLRRWVRSIDGHRYRAGDRVEITITERGYRAERVSIRIRYGALPRVKLL
jgi:hypothetical protein